MACAIRREQKSNKNKFCEVGCSLFIFICMNAAYYIKELGLLPHPEGGYYKEVYRSEGRIAAASLPPIFIGDRPYSTSIFYLLQQGDFSAFHRIKSDELWHFYAGGPLHLHLLDAGFGYQCCALGNNLSAGESFQVVMPAGAWFAAEPSEATNFSLAGCTVSPGFDFRDFEMGGADYLSAEFPEQRTLIERLSR